MSTPRRLDLAALEAGIPLVSDTDLYQAIDAPEQSALDLAGVDVVFSFLFWKRIRSPLIGLGRLGCLNFHPAPLPEMRGLGGYNVAILEDMAEWGVSAHYVDEHFDTGDVIRVERFPIDRVNETALSLDSRSQARLLELFRWAADELNAARPLPRIPQEEGRYVTREEFESMRIARLDDPPELTDRRIRAFWYPPYDGAVLEVGESRVTLVSRALLAEVALALNEAGRMP